MRLTTYTDYSLRMLIYLAAHPETKPTIAEIADRYGISRNHLTKVAHNLGLSGHVRTVRGRGGGLALARPANEIWLGDVVRTTEPDMALVPCFPGGEAPCAIAPACKLKNALYQAQKAFMDVLDSHSLADLTVNAAPLRTLFLTEPAPAI